MKQQTKSAHNRAYRQVHGRSRKRGEPGTAFGVDLTAQHEAIRDQHPATPVMATKPIEATLDGLVGNLKTNAVERPATYTIALDGADDKKVMSMRAKLRRAAQKHHLQISTQKSSTSLLVHVED